MNRQRVTARPTRQQSANTTLPAVFHPSRPIQFSVSLRPLVTPLPPSATGSFALSGTSFVSYTAPCPPSARTHAMVALPAGLILIVISPFQREDFPCLPRLFNSSPSHPLRRGARCAITAKLPFRHRVPSGRHPSASMYIDIRPLPAAFVPCMSFALLLPVLPASLTPDPRWAPLPTRS